MTYDKIEINLGMFTSCSVWIMNSKKQWGLEFEDVTIAELSPLLTRIREACVYADKHGVMKISSAKALKFWEANKTAELRETKCSA